MARRRVAAIVKIQLPASKPRLHRRSGRPSARMVCRRWSSASSTTPQPKNQRGTIIPVEITIYEDRSFTFVLKTPPTTFLIREAAGLEKGSQLAGRESAGSITDDQVAEIALKKMPDLNANDLEAAKRQVAGTARSMGVAVSK